MYVYIYFILYGVVNGIITTTFLKCYYAGKNWSPRSEPHGPDRPEDAVSRRRR